MRLNFYKYSMNFNLITSAKKSFFDLLFPDFCAGCGKEGVVLCVSCLGSLKYLSPICVYCRKIALGKGRVPPGRICLSCRGKTPLYSFFSPFKYEENYVRELVHRLKYNRLRIIAEFFSQCLAEYCRRFTIRFPKPMILIPMPLYRSRERARGFNQASLIAGHLAQELGLSVSENALVRLKNTKPQSGLNREERERNIMGAFEVKNHWEVKGKDILLLDDVLTTGFTMNEAARVLKEAGAKRVWGFTVAH